MKKFLVILFISFAVLSLNTAFAACPCPRTQNLNSLDLVNMKKNWLLNNFGRRAVFYNALSLSPQQRQKAEIIDSATIAGINPFLEDFLEQKMILLNLANSTTKKSLIRNQKKIVKSAKNRLDAYLKTRDDEFQKMLDHDQKVTFRQLKKQSTQNFNMQQKCVRKRLGKFVNPSPDYFD